MFFFFIQNFKLNIQYHWPTNCDTAPLDVPSLSSRIIFTESICVIQYWSGTSVYLSTEEQWYVKGQSYHGVCLTELERALAHLLTFIGVQFMQQGRCHVLVQSSEWAILNESIQDTWESADDIKNSLYWNEPLWNTSFEINPVQHRGGTSPPPTRFFDFW